VIAVDSPLVDEVRKLFTLDPEALQDPYPLYERLRNEAPVLQYDRSTLIVSRHVEAKVVYLDPERFPVATERGVRFAGKHDLLSDDDRLLINEHLEFEKLFSTNRNGPDHRRVRGAAQRAFSPRRVIELQESIETIFDELIEEYSSGGECDFMQISSRLPLYVIMNMLAVPRADAELLKKWSDELNIARTVLLPENVRIAHEALTKFRGYVAELVDRHRRTGNVGGLVADLLNAGDSDRVSDEEIVATFVHFLFAGHETTKDLIGNSIHAMLRHPDQWALLKQDPTLAGKAVEEVLRWDSPVQFFQRVAGPGAELAGEPVPEGSFVILMNAAANRDPDVFAGPDRFDITRYPNDHLSFGHGIHFCIGAPVARLEGQVVLKELVRRFPDLRSAGQLDDLRIAPNMSLRGYEQLPVVLGREASLT
jgi:cytochrome P450